jgi:hypothetical protein
MARSIGRRNIGLVRIEVERAVREGAGDTLEDLVISRLPDSLWDSWEGADSEIRRIIWDEFRGR